jgi:hypothetical protein
MRNRSAHGPALPDPRPWHNYEIELDEDLYSQMIRRRLHNPRSPSAPALHLTQQFDQKYYFIDDNRNCRRLSHYRMVNSLAERSFSRKRIGTAQLCELFKRRIGKRKCDY